MSERYIEQLIDDFRTDHPGIVEEWERQRADALEGGEPREDWPDQNTPDGLAWWLTSEVSLAREMAGRYPDGVERERGIEHYCLAALDDLKRMMASNGE